MKQSKKTKQKTNETKSWFSEKINKIDKPLTRLIKKKRERTPKNTIRNERGKVTTDTKEIQRIVGNITNNCMPTNWTIWTKKMVIFIEINNVPKLNQII